MASTPPPPHQLLGLNVHPLERDELLQLLWSWAEEAGTTRRMFYTNAHVFNLAYENLELRRMLNSADLLIVEGVGGKVGGRIVGVNFPEQLATMDWMDDFLAGLVQRGASGVHLVGDERGVAEACADAMRARHPGLEITGARDGFFDKVGLENDEVLSEIRQSNPSVLMVGMGTPVQEAWIERHLDELNVPLVLALGAMFRWYSGAEQRAPAWMRRMHLEWLHRLLHHPIRHFQRYVIGNPRFVIRCLRQRIGRPRHP